MYSSKNGVSIKDDFMISLNSMEKAKAISFIAQLNADTCRLKNKFFYTTVLILEYDIRNFMFRLTTLIQQSTFQFWNIENTTNQRILLFAIK